jgi:O-antigen/teichoic acid export membrane protein
MSSLGPSFTRSVLTLMGGTALAQAIPLLASPLLTRLYTPEQFGALALLLALANPLSLIVCGRYELAVVLPREDEEAGTLARLGLLLAVVVTLLLGAVIWTLRDVFGTWLGGEEARVPLLLSPLLFGLMGFFQPLNNWLIRKQAFRAMGLNKMVQTAGITGVSLLLGVMASRHGLLVGYIAGWVAFVIIGAWQARWKGLHFRPVDLAAMRTAAVAYRSFPLYNALPAMLHTATLSVPVFLLAQVFAEEVTGQFNLCRQTILLPVTFMATSFMQVYMQRAGRTVAEGGAVLPTLRGVVRALLAAALAMVAVLVVAGPWLFGVVFGTQWTMAGEYARILALPIALQLVVMPLTPLLPALGRIRAYGTWQVVYFAAVAVLGLGTWGGATTYLLALALVECACFLALGALIWRYAAHHDEQIAQRHA